MDWQWSLQRLHAGKGTNISSITYLWMSLNGDGLSEGLSKKKREN